MANITVIVLQLLAFVLLTNAMSVPNKCSNLPPKQNFNPQPYFNGQWYTTHLYAPGVTIPTDKMPCVTSKEHLISKHYVREINSNYQPSVDTFGYSEGFISLSEFTEGRGKYNEIVRSIDANGNPQSSFLEGSVTILDTDYKSYALVYMCVEIVDKVAIEYFAIMSRKQDAVLPSPKIEEILQRVGLKLTDFVSIEDRECKQDPNMKNMI